MRARCAFPQLPASTTTFESYLAGTGTGRLNGRAADLSSWGSPSHAGLGRAVPMYPQAAAFTALHGFDIDIAYRPPGNHLLTRSESASVRPGY